MASVLAYRVILNLNKINQIVLVIVTIDVKNAQEIKLIIVYPAMKIFT